MIWLRRPHNCKTGLFATFNCNQRFRAKKTKLNICHDMVTSTTQLQNRSFRDVESLGERLRNVKNENCTCKACKTIVFHCQICKFVRFLLPSSSWLRKLPNSTSGSEILAPRPCMTDPFHPLGPLTK